MAHDVSPRKRRGPFAAQHAASRGMALMEFALVLPIMLFLLLATVDFGHLIQTRLIMTNVSREGGSIASREAGIDPSIPGLLLASGTPLDLGGADGRIFVTKIAAGKDEDAPAPTISAQVTRGGLGVGSKIIPGTPTLGLTRKLYEHLVYKPAQGGADISEVTVVEILYKYRPITPVPTFLDGALLSDGGGLIISSKAVF